MNREFKVDIAEIHSYFGGDFVGKNPEVICQTFKDVLLKEGINVYLDKYEGIIDRLIFTKRYNPQDEIEDKISKYQKEINEHIPWLKYDVRIFKELKISVADLRNNFGGDLFKENPEIIYQIFKYILSNEGIDVYLCKCADKYELILKKSFDGLDNIQPQFDKSIKNKILKYRVPLKPWKDPESLFCDTKFLREFLGKEPRKGKECKNAKKQNKKMS